MNWGDSWLPQSLYGTPSKIPGTGGKQLLTTNILLPQLTILVLGNVAQSGVQWLPGTMDG